MGNSEETIEIRRESLIELRKLIVDKEKTDIPQDDRFLLKFLRVTKFDVEKAFDRINHYVEGRQRYAKDYEKVNKTIVKSVFEAGILQLLDSKTTEDGRSIFYLNFRNCDPRVFTSEHIFLASVGFLEKLLDQEEYQTVGHILIANFNNFSWRHAIQWTPSLVTKIVRIVLRMLPFRVHQLHFVNEMSVVRILYNTCIYPFLSEKLKGRVFLHGSNLESLQICLEKAVLPIDLGGTGQEKQVDKLMEQLYTGD